MRQGPITHWLFSKWGVYGWGDIGSGQIGDAQDKLKLVLNWLGIPDKVVGLATGAYRHSLVVTENGEVYGWGRNDYVQLGDGTTKDRNRPSVIKGIPGKVVGVAAGSSTRLLFLMMGRFMAGEGMTMDSWETENSWRYLFHRLLQCRIKQYSQRFW